MVLPLIEVPEIDIHPMVLDTLFIVLGASSCTLA